MYRHPGHRQRLELSAIPGTMTTPCFLCAPDSELIVDMGHSTFSMVGLGPITRTYVILSARDHIRSLADMHLQNPEATGELLRMRYSLEDSEGPLLMTEHGRVPVCRDDGDLHEQHCFHAHALLFRSSANILEPAASYYSEHREFETLNEALNFAATTDHYLLISPANHQYVVLAGPLNAPRQLTRTLVALAEGVGELADWRDRPRRDIAREMADRIRDQL